MADSLASGHAARGTSGAVDSYQFEQNGHQPAYDGPTTSVVP
jgi:hypothetical protein